MLENKRGPSYAALAALLGRRPSPEQRAILDRAIDEILALKESSR